MIVSTFEYTDHGWHLGEVSFGSQNLIVGKNAVGKSKTLHALVLVAKFIKGDMRGYIPAHSCRIVFTLEEGRRLEFAYSYENNVVLSEFLRDGEMILVDRNKDAVVVRDEPANPPVNRLCVQSQRDTSKNPEFEYVISWAEQMRGFSFSDLSSSKSYDIPNMFDEKLDFVELFEHIGDERKDFIIQMMHAMGYDIDNIEPFMFSDKYKMITLYEQGVSIPLFVSSVSNGMLRVFYIFTYLSYVATEEGAKTLLIDDLGEGLDFSRSKKLSKLIFGYCAEHNIQLIATTNDNFLMNAVSLSHWVILLRNKQNIKAFSEHTHPEMFAKFKRTGLNNFDMLGTDFVYNYLKESGK